MRAFIAIEIPRDVKSELSQIIDTLRSSQADVKWVKPQDVHLTLKFLGNIDQSRLKEIQNILDRVAKTENSFEMSMEDLSAFPNPSFPRVIWTGLKQGSQNTLDLAKKIECELAKIGFAKEKRPFHPHLTLGRLRSPKNRDKLSVLLSSTTFKSQSRIKVTHLNLIQSTLTPTGSIYTPLYQTALS
ncbi:MAG: RNA 2',3'-cyclic phosphodiesterase [Candidatus Omnitrophota bacterium]|nr:RNA 2',3'-cyclic phosphodiesterase [Candidatus Omnitrophota bacterium]